MDPIKSGTNWYVYCENNPLKFVDMTGLFGSHTTENDCNDYYDNYLQRNDPDYLNAGWIRTQAGNIQTQLENLAREKSPEELNSIVDLIFAALDEFFATIGVPPPDGMILFSVSGSAYKYGLGVSGGFQLLLTRGYGLTVFTMWGGGIGYGHGVSFEVGLVWGLNGTPKGYSGPFVTVGGSYKSGTVNVAFWGNVMSVTGGISFGSDFSFYLKGEMYSPVWDNKAGWFPDFFTPDLSNEDGWDSPFSQS